MTSTRQTGSAKPTVSVLMTVYNGERFLKRAVDSILGQSFEDFELIVVDDGSTDRTPEIIRSYDDSRLRCFFQSNKGIAEAKNRGAREIRSDLVAIMDADDVSMPDRLTEQVRFLRDHDSVALLGTGFVIIDEDDAQLGVVGGIPDDEDIRRLMHVRDPCAHGSIMMRRKAFERAGRYNTAYVASVDTDLYYRVAEQGRFANLPEVLYWWRFTTHGIGHTHLDVSLQVFEKLSRASWQKRPPRALHRGQVASKFRAYRALGARAGVPLAQQYLEDELGLGMVMWRRNPSKATAIAHLAAVIATAPREATGIVNRRSRAFLIKRFRLIRLVAHAVRRVVPRRGENLPRPPSPTLEELPAEAPSSAQGSTPA